MTCKKRRFFIPLSPDPYIKTEGDMGLAKFGHLNAITDRLDGFDANQSITAHAGGGQALAEPLIVGFNAVETETTGDSVVLPKLSLTCSKCADGTVYGPLAPVIIKNNGPGSLSIYPALGESIDGLAVNTPLVLDPGASISITDLDCTSWASYANSTDPAFTGVNSVTGCLVDNTDPANPVINDISVAVVSATEALTGDGCTTPLSVCIDNVTITKDPSGCLQAVASPASIGYAEYVQHTQAPNNSIPPGQAIEYLTDNPLGVYNTLGIVTATGPAAIGTAFQLPVGVYMIDYENSAAAASSFAIYQGASNTVLAIDTDTISGSTTGTTWIHGRAIITSTVGNDWIMISSVVGTADIPTAGTAAGEFIARLTILKLA